MQVMQTSCCWVGVIRSVSGGCEAGCPRPISSLLQISSPTSVLPLNIGSSCCCSLYIYPTSFSHLITAWEWGVASMGNSLYGLYGLPGLEPMPHTTRGPNCSVPQRIGELSHIPMASQGIEDKTVSSTSQGGTRYFFRSLLPLVRSLEIVLPLSASLQPSKFW
jgi:hypothetical protein